MAEPDLDRRSILRWSLGLPAAIVLGARRAFASECAATQQDFQGPMYLPGAPLSKALVDVWHADAKGEYHGANESYRLRGQMLTNDRGEYEFDSVKPGNYGDSRGMRPAHFHLTISSPGHESMTTQLYFKGDPYLSHDMCGPACHSDDPHRIIELARQAKGLLGTFDLVLKAARA